MKLSKRLLYNTALLTASSLVMRTIGLAYQVWLVGKIGDAGIGLFQLVMSVAALAMTFAISGIRFACTRLVSEEIGKGNYGGVTQTMRRCLGYSLFFGVSAALIMYFAAEPIGFLWIGDARTVPSLRLFSVSLPFISLSAVFNGYFTAVGRVYKSAFIQISEQLVRIALVSFFLNFVQGADIERSCAAVVLAGSAAEVFSFILITSAFLLDKRRHIQPGEFSPRLTRRMLGVAVPLAVSAYARSSLSTLEHMLVPRGLRSAGFSADKAMSGYGIIQGMVFPIIYYPSCIMMALSEMLVPEMTEAQMAGNDLLISRTASSLLQKCMTFAIGVSALFFTFSRELGLAVYGSSDASYYIKVFSLLIPVIYMDMVTDGMLKGLGQQMYSMSYNIMDALISVVLVYSILPKFALPGYIVIIFFTECFNFGLSIRRLTKITEIKLRPFAALFYLACAAGSAQFMQFLLRAAAADVTASAVHILIALAAGGLIYFGLVRLTGYGQLFNEQET